ncbi:olfactory receptor 56A4-like [Ambystoma mexicanum]|uniref:olfactory receptor 56A4-like n=1 Tax=Ambystoma mexicanum TaxID=8296 RepID=UPI0037E784A8
MATRNITSTFISEFQLVCFPGLQNQQHWLSIPLALLFAVAISANIALITAVFFSPTLHQPMYFFLCLLALVDLLLTYSILPKALAILLFNQKTISSAGCFSQTFLAYFCQGMESTMLLLLAYDRYIAICSPLHYSSIMTRKWSAQAVGVSFLCNGVIYLPFPFLVVKLSYCVGNTVAHCFCESLALAEIACGNTSLNYAYALAVASVVLGILTIALIFSYTMIIRAVMMLGSTASALKAFSTCSSHLIVTGIVYCFLIIAAISSRVKEFMPRYAHILLAMLRYLTLPALNPLVYGIRTQDLRQAIKKMLGKAQLYHCM